MNRGIKRDLAKFLYRGDYFVAWKCVPFLLMGTVFSGISQFEGSLFAATKNTKSVAKPGVRKEMLAGFPQEVEEYVLPAEEKCSVCGGEMKVTGKNVNFQKKFHLNKIKRIKN